jgi:HEAT repeat protein
LSCKHGAAPSRPIPDAAPLPELVRLDDVTVQISDWPDSAGAPPQPRELAHRIWEELAGSPDFAAGRGDAGAAAAERHARVKMDVAVSVDNGTLRGVVTLALVWAESRDDEEPPPWDSEGCESPAPPDRKDMPAAAAGAIECALPPAARGLAQRESVRRGRLDDVLAALASPDPSLRQFAFAAIGDHHLRAAVPKLLAMLKSDDVLVRDGAIGALVALRERSAVKALTDLGQFKDLDMMRRIIDAVGAIGGDEARAYLELVASGHDVPAVRELATQALDRLRRREADAG